MPPIVHRQTPLTRYLDRETSHGFGRGGDDRIRTGAGADTLGGGAGDDVYVLRGAGDRLSEREAAGEDCVWSHLDFARLPAHVENGRVVTAGSADLLGHASSNVLCAGPGDKLLGSGRGGEADPVSCRYGVAPDAVSGVGVSLRAGAGQDTGASGRDRLVRIENLTGSRLDDALSGCALDHVLEGSGGDDNLADRPGADTLMGGGRPESVGHRSLMR